jgi:hypothetical protein
MSGPYPLAVAEYPRVRQSILSQFDNCRLLAGMSRELEAGWSSHAQARGQVIHRAIAKCLIEMAQHEENRIEPDVALAILRECLRQADVPAHDVVALPASEVKDMVWTIQKWAKDNTFDISSLVAVEERITAGIRYPDPEGGFVERQITGALDALFITPNGEHATVLDWKDTWGIPGPTDLSFDGYFQQRVYAYLVMKQYREVQSVTTREFYVRFSEPRNATVHRSDMEEIEAELSALVENWDRAVQHGVMPWEKSAKDLRREMRAARREAERLAGEGDVAGANAEIEKWRALRDQYNVTVGLWKPAPGAHCSFCPRPQACTIQPQARGAGRITDADAAKRVAAETVAAEAIVKKGKMALKEWVDKNGPVDVRDAKGVRQFAHIPQNKTRRVTQEMIEEEIEKARRAGREPDIDGLYERYIGTRFGLYKPKPTVDGEPDPEDQSLLEQLEASVEAAEEARRRREAA